MASKYERLRTAEELIQEVRVHGLSTAQEDIVRAQDIFGRSSLDELVKLANDIGRVNEKGESDPNGSWCSGKPGTQNLFYSILFQIWNWEDATRFWNEHTNIATKEARVTEATNRELKKQVAGLQAQLQAEREEVLKQKAAVVEYQQSEEKAQKRVDNLEVELQFSKAEIVELKAKLYDLMVAGKEQKR